MPSDWRGEWNAVGRANIGTTPDSVVVQGGFVTGSQVWGDAEITFRARAPLGVGQVQIWGGFRLRAEALEFWQQRDDRLHDRLRYTHEPDDRWRVERLGP